MHVADGAQNPQEVEFHDCLAVAQLLCDAPEELGLCDTDGDRSREAAYFQEGI